MPDMKTSLRTIGWRNWRDPRRKQGTTYAGTSHHCGKPHVFLRKITFVNNTPGKEPWQEAQGLQSLEASPRPDLRCRHGEGELRVQPNSQRLRYLLQHYPQGVRQKGYLHQGQSRDLRQDSRRTGTHRQKKSVVAPWKQKQEYLYCKSYPKRHHAGGNSTRDRSSTDKVITPNQETLDLQKKWNFAEYEKTSSRVHCAYCNV